MNLPSRRTQYMIVGAISGLVVGAVAAYLAADAQDERSRLLAEDPEAPMRQIKPREWIGFAVAVLALMRQFAQLIAHEKSRD